MKILGNTWGKKRDVSPQNYDKSVTLTKKFVNVKQKM